VRISHDKVSGALYVELREGEYDHTEDFSDGADVYLDVDAKGTVLGLEALSFEDLAQAIDEHGGQLEVPDRLGTSDESEADANLSSTEIMAALTPRDREVLQLLAEGLTDREIAERLILSLSIVRVSLRNVMRALGARNRSEAQTRLTSRRSG
jgi:DNA-binding NarL/FixJ family response regulator